MLMTAVSEYTKKNKENLQVTDLILMQKSLEETIGDYRSNETEKNLRTWRKENRISRFGGEQYRLLEKIVDYFLK